jgi:hypothetical protein
VIFSFESMISFNIDGDLPFQYVEHLDGFLLHQPHSICHSLSVSFSYSPSKTKTELNFVALVRERTMPTERPPLVGEVVPTFVGRGCRVVSAADSYGR